MTTLSPDDIKREIEREAGCEVGFQWTPFYIVETDAGGVRMDFSAKGHSVMTRMWDADLTLPMDQFATKIIKPAVQVWRNAVGA